MAEVTATWEQSVEKARLASLKSFEGRLETARASFEQFPPNGKGVPKGRTLAHFAEEAGVEYESLMEYRRLSEWWGDSGPVPGISYSMAREGMKSGKWKTRDAFLTLILNTDPPTWPGDETYEPYTFPAWTYDALCVHLGRPPTNTGKLAMKVLRGEKVTKDDEHAAAALDHAEEAKAEVAAIKSKLKQAGTGGQARSAIKKAEPDPVSVIEEYANVSLLNTGHHTAISQKRRELVALLAKEKEWLIVNGATVIPAGDDPDEKEETIAEIVYDTLSQDKGLIDEAFADLGIGGESIERGFAKLLQDGA